MIFKLVISYLTDTHLDPWTQLGRKAKMGAICATAPGGRTKVFNEKGEILSSTIFKISSQI